MHKIVPHLWYDKEAGEAAALYTSLFPRFVNTFTVHDVGYPFGHRRDTQD
jgi:predicted 3-demethylubiquinone-9 3-methyltransferase (glyoxalase superfamily)